MMNVGVIGATGYTGEEIVKVLVRHPHAKIASLSAIVDGPVKYHELFPYFAGRLDLACKELDTEEVKSACKLVFLALPHTVSMQYARGFLEAGIKVIDLSADYRLPADIYEKWYGKKHSDVGNLAKAVYGLPELYRDNIKNASLIANPGCYPTATILACAPVVKAGLAEDISVDAKSGVTGAGRKASIPLSYAEVGENLKAYKVNAHQHMPEMSFILSEAGKKEISVKFVPHLVPMRRGILSTVYIKLNKDAGENKIHDLYRQFYKKEKFVRVYDKGKLPEIKDVVGTNYCDMGLRCEGASLIVISCIDNLLKGAGGQAVQNMNIMCGFDEREGLDQ